MTLEKAISLLIEQDVPEHIIHHSFKVAKIVWVVGYEIKSSHPDFPLDCELAFLSALLHDITKYQSILNRGEDHSLTGGMLLKKLGYPEIGEIIESHVVIRNPERLTNEKELVFYADKRVKHDKIVSLEERFEDLKIRYGLNDKVMLGYKTAKAIERKLTKLGIKPQYLNFLN